MDFNTIMNELLEICENNCDEGDYIKASKLIKNAFEIKTDSAQLDELSDQVRDLRFLLRGERLDNKWKTASIGSLSVKLRESQKETQMANHLNEREVNKLKKEIEDLKLNGYDGDDEIEKVVKKVVENVKEDCFPNGCKRYTIEELASLGWYKINKSGKIDKRCKAFKRMYVNLEGELLTTEPLMMVYNNN